MEWFKDDIDDIPLRVADCISFHVERLDDSFRVGLRSEKQC